MTKYIKSLSYIYDALCLKVDLALCLGKWSASPSGCCTSGQTALRTDQKGGRVGTRACLDIFAENNDDDDDDNDDDDEVNNKNNNNVGRQKGNNVQRNVKIFLPNSEITI